MRGTVEANVRTLYSTSRTNGEMFWSVHIGETWETLTRRALEPTVPRPEAVLPVGARR
jgi:hypothetical protein